MSAGCRGVVSEGASLFARDDEVSARPRELWTGGRGRAQERAQIAVQLTSGEELQRIVGYILSAPDSIKERLAPIILHQK